MLRLRGFARRLRTVFDKRRFEAELDEELQFHLEREIEGNLARGMAPQEARRVAIRSFGGVEQTKIDCREVGGIRFLDELTADVGHGLRILRKSPGFTAVAVLTLVLGIGANVAVFSVVNGVLLRPLPFPGSDRIMTLWNTYPGASESLGEVSPPDFCDWREESRSFAQMAAWERFFWTIGGDPEPLRVQGARVSGDFFAVMGVEPRVGRVLLPADDHEGVHHVVVLSHTLWTNRFGADPSVVGRTVMLTGVEHAIVGVMPPGFGFPDGVALWTPLAYEPPFSPALRRMVWLRTVARLGPGVTPEQAQAELSAIAGRLAERYPATNEGRSAGVVSLFDHTVGSVRRALLVLLGAVGFVLLIACTNVVNLLLGQAASRHREIALRAAMGASRLRIVRQLVTESTVLGLLGGSGGLLLAWSSLAVLRRIAVASVPRMANVHLDLRVLIFALLASLAAGVVAGIVPAVVMTGGHLQQSLQEAGPRTADSRRRKRWRHALVVTEVALAEVLLIGGGLLFQSFLHMRSVSPGFEPEGILAGRFELFARRYTTAEQRETFYGETVERVAALPGVRSVTLATTIPMDEVQMTLDLIIDGRPPPSTPAETPWAGFNSVTPGYFRTMGIPLVAGRPFTRADTFQAPAVAVVNRELADRYWPGESPLGRRFRLLADSADDDAEPIAVVGVVEDVHQVSLTSEVRPEIYLPYAQRPWKEGFLLIRWDARPEGVVSTARQVLREIDPTIALSDFRQMRAYISDSLGPPRFHAALATAFAVLALALAAAGVFGVVAHSVAQRNRELAIRVALGAQLREVFALIVKEGVVPVLAGVAAGLVLALALTSTVSSLLFGIVATNPSTYAGVALMLTLVATAACSLPGRRAMGVDPAVALRCE